MNKYIKIIAFLLIISLISAFSLSVSGARINAALAVSARAACLIEENGKLIYGKSENVRLPMASTTKIMTALIALESGISLNTLIKVPKEAVGIEGSSIYLSEGETITFEALLYGLLLSSANDAAIAIAIATYGSVEGFVDKMNKKASSLGLSDTKFANPHGLYDNEHYTTAIDLARLMAYCIKNESFVNISGCDKIVFPKDDNGIRVMINHNKLLRENIDVIAGKTGFTKKSGRCLVTCAKRDGLTLICVTLDAPNDWNDHKSLYELGYQSYQMLHLPSVTITLPLVAGKSSEITAKSLPRSVVIPKDQSVTEAKFELPRFLFAGLKKGTKIGQVIYLYNGRILATSPIFLSEDATGIQYKFNLFEWIKYIFSKSKDR